MCGRACGGGRCTETSAKMRSHDSVACCHKWGEVKLVVCSVSLMMFSLKINFYTVVILCFCVSMQSIQNLGLAIIAIAAGMILDTRGYLFLEVFFSACVCSKCYEH